MALCLWLFWAYSFLGYLLEKAYAAATASPRYIVRVDAICRGQRLDGRFRE